MKRPTRQIICDEFKESGDVGAFGGMFCFRDIKYRLPGYLSDWNQKFAERTTSRSHFQTRRGAGGGMIMASATKAIMSEAEEGTWKHPSIHLRLKPGNKVM